MVLGGFGIFVNVQHWLALVLEAHLVWAGSFPTVYR